MLEAKGITVEIEDRSIVRDVSVAVGPGELLAVLGENGAGKSTLLRLLAGDRVSPRARVTGEVMLAGRNVLDWPLAERARLRAVLPQRPEIAFAFSAREVAAFGRYPSGGRWHAAPDREIADAALVMSDALHLAEREVATLSGGEQARVHLAAAFAQLWEVEYPHPRFLLLDEPTAALDLAHQHALLATSREFARTRRIGVVAILHDLNLAASYADRVLLMHKGRVLAQGAPADVLQASIISEGFGVAAHVLPHPLTDGMLIATAAMR